MIRAARVLTILTLAWGGLAFGAPYVWTEVPLMCGCLLVGALSYSGIRTSALPSRGRPVSTGLVVAMVSLVLAVLVQLVPIESELFARVSPAGDYIVRQLDVGYAVGLEARHPLSISPAATRRALALTCSFFVFAVGLARLLSVTGVRWFAWAITVLGVILALVGIIQKPFFAGRIYGFWTPMNPGNVFGPFVNRNHFAGWMVMALPLSLGLWCGGVARGMRGVRSTLRDRALWFTSRDAGQLVLLGLGTSVMALSLVMTMSRSGLTAFALGLVITATTVVRGVEIGSRRSIVAFFLVAVFVVVVGWVGADAILARFTGEDWSEFGGRRGAWLDAWNIAGRFPFVGSGLNTYGQTTLFFQQHDLVQHYAQAHNDYLQLWAEGGVLLAIPAALIAVALILRIWKQFRADDVGSTSWWLRAGAVTGLLAIALQETVDFSLQMPGNAALCAALAAVALHTQRDRRRE